MNTDQLAKMLGKTVKLRPIAVGERDGVLLRRPDDDWEVHSVKKTPPKAVTLANIHTGQTITLQGDNVHDFRSPNFLLLDCQVITIWPRGWRLEPRPHMWAPRATKKRKA